MSHGEESFSVTLLHLICDATEEQTHSCKARKQIDLIWRQHIRSTTGVAQKHQEKGLVTKMEISDCRRLNVLKISEVKWSYRSSQLPSGRITSSRGGRVSPLFDGATGESTAENTDSLASSMSCWVNCPDLAQSTPRRNADKVCTEFGSLRDTRRITSGHQTFYTSLLFSILIHLFFSKFALCLLDCQAMLRWI